jgi:hypothetical protein
LIGKGHISINKFFLKKSLKNVLTLKHNNIKYVSTNNYSEKLLLPIAQFNNINSLVKLKQIGYSFSTTSYNNLNYTTVFENSNNLLTSQLHNVSYKDTQFNVLVNISKSIRMYYIYLILMNIN